MERKDRRKHFRIETSFEVSFSIDCTPQGSEKGSHKDQKILGFARTKNISIGGMHLQITSSPYETRMSLTPANGSMVVGNPIEVFFGDPDLEIWGEVVRIESPSLDIGIVITKVSDVSLWKQFCHENTHILSIFPDTPRTRRMRRS